jgi:hypothetical protein
MQVLAAEGTPLSQPDANKKIPKGIREDLELTAATANHLRQEFVNERLLAVEVVGQQQRHTITAQGEMELGATELYPGVEWKLEGATINRLMEVVRNSAKQFERSEDGGTDATATRPSATTSPGRTISSAPTS